MNIRPQLICPVCGKPDGFARVKVGFFSRTPPLQCKVCNMQVKYSSRGEAMSILGFVLLVGSTLLLRHEAVEAIIAAAVCSVLGGMLVFLAEKRRTLVVYQAR